MSTTATVHAGLEGLESRTLLGADLAITLGAITISNSRSQAVVHVPTTLSNIGDADYASGGTIHYFLSTDQVLDAADISWTTRALPNLATGATTNFNLDAARPARLVANGTDPAVPAGTYFVIGAIEFPTGVTDDNPANNVAATAGTLNIDYRFGNVDGHRVTLTTRTGDNQITTFKLDGPGTGTVVNNAGQLLVTVDGSSSRNTSLIISSHSRTNPVINGITINGSALRIRLDRVGVSGNITVNGKLQEINATDISNGTVLITQAGRFTDIRAHNLTDVTINSAGPIKTLDVNRWSAGDATIRDALIAPSVERISSRHEFAADLAINRTSRGDAVKNVDVKGALTGTWTITGNVGDVAAGTTGDTWTANISGGLKSLRVRGDASGKIAAGSIKTLDFKHNVTGMTVLAGANLGSDGVIGGTGDAADTFTGATIKDINVNGNLTDSTFAAGVDPVNGIFGDAGDLFLSPSAIGHTRVRGTTTNSFFLASMVNAKHMNHEDHDNEDHGNGNGNGNGNGGHEDNKGNGNQANNVRDEVNALINQTVAARRTGLSSMFRR